MGGLVCRVVEAGAEYEALGRAALAEERLLSAGEHLARAAVHFHFGKTKLVGGVSLGGYDAPRVAAALGDRVKACVALSGPYDLDECGGQLPQLTRRTFEVRSGASGEEEDARRIAGTLTWTARGEVDVLMLEKATTGAPMSSPGIAGMPRTGSRHDSEGGTSAA